MALILKWTQKLVYDSSHEVEWFNEAVSHK